MLVLTRRRDQGIRVGSDVRIVVLSVSGEQVRIGIEAPAHKSILRDEVFERIAQANSDAANQDVPASLRGEQEGEEA